MILSYYINFSIGFLDDPTTTRITKLNIAMKYEDLGIAPSLFCSSFSHFKNKTNEELSVGANL